MCAMKRGVLPLVALVAVGAIAVVWVLGGRGGDDPRPPGGDPPAGPSEPQEGVGQGSDPIEPATGPDAGADPVTEPGGEGRESVDPEEDPALWIEGVVILAAGSPEDERVEVGLEGGEPPVPVAENGSFRLRRPAEGGSHTVQLTALYHHLDEPVRVDAGTPGSTLRLEPTLGGRLWVEVRVPDGEPRGLETTLVLWDGVRHIRRRAPEREAGRFELTAVPSADVWDVEVLAETWVDVRREGIQVKPGETETLEIELLTGALLAGRVVDADGAPIQGAEVSASSRLGEGNLAIQQGKVEAETGADGTFELPGIAPGTVDLAAKAQGRVPLAETLGRLADGEERRDLELALNAGATLSGIVRWSQDAGGGPAADALVLAQDARNPWGRGHRARSAEDGSFEIVALPAERYRLVARAEAPEDSGQEGLWLAGLDGVAAGAADLVLELMPGDRLSGQVVDDADEPVTRFRVTALPIEEAHTQIRHVSKVEEVVEDDGGRFELTGLGPGRWRVTVETPSHVPPLAALLTLPDEGAPLRFVCARRGSVAGKVLDDAGTPVGGAEVTITEPGQRQPRKATTDDEGAFTAEGLQPGPVELVATSDQHAPSETTLAHVVPGSFGEAVELTVSAGATITGRVHPEVWKEGARGVLLSPAAEMAFVDAEVDADGNFKRSGLAPGFYRVSLDWRGQGDWVEAYSSRREEIVELTVEAPTHVVIGDPAAKRLRVHGRVTDGGEPVDGYTVYVFRPNGPSTQPVTISRTDADGTFEVVLSVPDLHHFSIGKQQTEQTLFPREVPDAPETSLTFEMPTSAIRGVLLGPDGTPRAKQVMLLTVADAPPDSREFGEMRTGSTDEEGRFEFRGLAPGRYRLRDGGFLTSSGETPFAYGVHTDLVLEPDSDLDVELRLEAEAIIEGRLVDVDGSAVVGAQVRVTYATGEPHQIWSPILTDYAGNFRLRGVASGPVQIQAEAADGRVAETALEARAGSTERVELSLP